MVRCRAIESVAPGVRQWPAVQLSSGSDARDHLLTLFGFDRWLGQQKQQKRHRPARRIDNAQAGTDVPMPNPLEYAQAKYRGTGQLEG
jgi:hypothetical protein